jgi:hypothetical protein
MLRIGAFSRVTVTPEVKSLGVTVGLSFVALALLGASSVAATSASTTAAPRLQWSKGIEAKLPANAAKNRVVFIDSVSCASAGNCSAVGWYKDSSGSHGGLLLAEKAGRWSRGVEATLPANAQTKQSGLPLDSVSCASAGNCSAVGGYTDNSGSDQGLLLTERGGRWRTGVEVALPANASTSHGQVLVFSVSCPSAGNCTALGEYTDNSSNDEGLLLTETAGRWGTGVEAPLPANAAPDPFVAARSISCASAGNCSAVGQYVSTTHPGGDGLLLTETAGKWIATEAAVPAHGGAGLLQSVSCASAGNCSATGGYADSSGGDGMLLTETAGTWGAGVKAQLPANACPVGQCDSAFNVYSPIPISCASAGNCTAVGDYLDSKGNERGFLLTETAGKWAAGVEAPGPAAAPDSVSCASPGKCSAVGFTSALTQTGGKWTAAKLGLPANAVGGGQLELDSVSCGSAAYCSAVGNYIEGSGDYQGLLVDSRPVPCLVPRLAGRTLDAARRSIRSHSCSLGKVGRAPSRTIEKGRVISQRPEPGKRLRHRAKVNLVLSTG